MRNTIKMISGLLVFFLLFNVLMICTPVSSGVIPVNSLIEIDWSGDTESPIVPRDEVRALNITVTYQATFGGEVGEGVIDTYSKQIAVIDLEIIDSSSWVTANLKATKVVLDLSNKPNSASNYINLQVNENAPAFEMGYVTIRASVGKLGVLPPLSREVSLNFMPAYLPIIDASYPEGNSLEIMPDDSAVFPVELENMGNARTKVFFEIEDAPDGWTAVVTDDVTLDESPDSTTAYVTVKPPKEFGYREDRAIITVSMLPKRAENLEEQGVKTYATFVVHSKGYFTPGFESILFFGALLFVAIIGKKRLNAKK